MNTNNNEYLIKVSSIISFSLNHSDEPIVEGCQVSLLNLDEDEKNAFSDEAGGYNETGMEALILALRYGLAHVIKFGSNKGYWPLQERALEENNEILRIIEIESKFSESTTKKIVIDENIR